MKAWSVHDSLHGRMCRGHTAVCKWFAFEWVVIGVTWQAWHQQHFSHLFTYDTIIYHYIISEAHWSTLHAKQCFEIEYIESSEGPWRVAAANSQWTIVESFASRWCHGALVELDFGSSVSFACTGPTGIEHSMKVPTLERTRIAWRFCSKMLRQKC